MLRTATSAAPQQPASAHEVKVAPSAAAVAGTAAGESEHLSSFHDQDAVVTEETFSDRQSASDMSHDGPYEVIEYDLSHQAVDGKDAAAGAGQWYDTGVPFMIDEDSPAAAALRANATVHVSSVGKVARAVHMQAVRKFVKRATGHTRSGVVRGKPPRLPPMRETSFGTAEPGSSLQLESIPEDRKFKSEALVPQHDEQAALRRKSAPNMEDKIDRAESRGEIVSEAQMHTDAHLMDKLDAATNNQGGKYVQTTTVDLPDGVVAGTVEAGKKVLGNVDPHDLLKLVRWRGKKKGGKKQNKSYVKGKVIDGEHELYTLSIAVMIGVRTSIARTNSELNDGPGKRWVQLQDFRTTEKYEFRPKGGGLTPPHQLAHTFKFKDYSPVVFAYLRRMFGVNEFDFLLSVCGNANFIEFISNAKSGQFFFYSQDGRYMIKTMTNAESKFLRRILPQYFRHCAENPNTMMTRFFGMYRVKLYHLRRNVKFVVMNSVYHTDKHLQSFYDLKGSVLGRDAKPHDAVKKDNDMRRGLPEEALALPPNVQKEVKAQLEKDCEFFRDTGIMDYSMLVGIHHVPTHEDARVSMASAAAQSTTTLGGMSLRNFFSFRNNRARAVSNAETESDEITALANSGRRHKRHPSAEDVPLHGNDRPDLLRRHQSESRGGLFDGVGSFLHDDGLDDDDCSYIMGSEKRPLHLHGTIRDECGDSTNNDEEGEQAQHSDTEYKKMETIEKLYWPFHRLFDIHGHRLAAPATCPKCGSTPCDCCGDEEKLLAGYNIPKFVAPLSDRKDGGFEMDVSGLDLPMKLKGPQGKQIMYQGKIFYMGVIDILQEFTPRKMVESQYRSLQSGALAASCVPPKDYGQRFLDFFDEYTRRIGKGGKSTHTEASSLEPSRPETTLDSAIQKGTQREFVEQILVEAPEVIEPEILEQEGKACGDVGPENDGKPPSEGVELGLNEAGANQVSDDKRFI